MPLIDTIMFVLSGIAALVTVLVLVLKPVVKKAQTRRAKWESFMRDWNGEAGEPGRDPAAGVMQRLNKIDGEFKRNGGSTMKDDVANMKESIFDIKEGLGRIEESLVSLTTADSDLKNRLTALENPTRKRAAPKPAAK